MIKEVAEFLEKLNEVLDEWESLAYKPNDVRELENVLENFYDNNMLEVRDVGRFDIDVTLSIEQENELYDIAQQFKDKDIYLEDLEKKFESAKGKHDIETLEDYAEFIDEKTIFENSVISSSKMSYYEYEALLERASKDKRRTEKSTNKMIEDAYLNQGLEGSDLYDFIYDKLSTKNSNRKQPKKSNRSRK